MKSNIRYQYPRPLLAKQLSMMGYSFDSARQELQQGYDSGDICILTRLLGSFQWVEKNWCLKSHGIGSAVMP